MNLNIYLEILVSFLGGITIALTFVGAQVGIGFLETRIPSVRRMRLRISNLAKELYVYSGLREWRDKRLMDEFFGIINYAPQIPPSITQRKMVDSALSHYASVMDNAFANQEFWQRYGGSWTGWNLKKYSWYTEQGHAAAKQTMSDTDRTARRLKTLFWSAHALAKRNGFPVKPNYKDYLQVDQVA